MAPSVVLVGLVAINAGLGWGMASTLLAGPLFVLVSCTVVVGGKRAVMPAARAGIHPERSGFGLRRWLSDHLIAMSRVTRALYESLYLKPFLRLLGARIGRWAEVSTITYIDPDMLTLGEESFLAGETVVAPAVFHRGCVAVAPALVGRRSFVGNGAILPGSCQMGDNSLLGVHSVPPTSAIPPGTAWLGSPAMFLPRRQESQKFPEELTFRPRRGKVAGRLAIEFVSIALPWIFLELGVLLDANLTFGLAAVLSPLALLALMPVLTFGLGLAMYLAVVLVKWVVIGRYRPRVEPMWNLFVRRTELMTSLYITLAVPMLVGLFTGTPFIGPLLRLLGARIGRRAWIAATALSEFDMVEVGDDAALNEDAALQTHLYEDRVMKMSRVKVGAGSSLGACSVVLYDAEVGAGAFVDAATLVMKGESLPPGTRWRGIPARAIGGGDTRASTTEAA
jgi:non-ribosomal peptide synthetase-like protein